jgi:hypothetical protein
MLLSHIWALGCELIMVRNEMGTRPREARLLLLLLLSVFLGLVAATQSDRRIDPALRTRRGAGDVALYRAEVDRMQQGQGYYVAADQELRTRGYPTKSVFNWRTPVPVGLVGSLPNPNWGKLLLAVLALGAVVQWFAVQVDELGKATALVGCVLMLGACLPVLLGDLYLMPEVWGGILIALSAGLLARGHRNAGGVVAWGALWVRELSALYYLLAMGDAVCQRRWKELPMWCAGIAIYAMGYAVHLQYVQGLIQPDDLAHEQGWFRMGGAAFVVATSQMNCFLLILPQWVSALFLAVALAGFWGWQTPAGRWCATIVAAYVTAFAFVGQEFNQYWGSMFAPLLALGAANGPATVRQLLQSARRKSTSCSTMVVRPATTSLV